MQTSWTRSDPAHPYVATIDGLSVSEWIDAATALELIESVAEDMTPTGTD